MCGKKFDFTADINYIIMYYIRVEFVACLSSIRCIGTKSSPPPFPPHTQTIGFLFWVSFVLISKEKTLFFLFFSGQDRPQCHRFGIYIAPLAPHFHSMTSTLDRCRVCPFSIRPALLLFTFTKRRLLHRFLLNLIPNCFRVSFFF